MANQIRIKRRAASGGAGAPAALLNAELAYNEASNILYYGYGDDGSGNATSVVAIAGEGNAVTLGTNQTISGDKEFSGNVNLSGTWQIGGVTVTASAAELNHLVGVSSGIQGQLDAATADIGELVSLAGVSAGDTDLGQFTGSVIDDNQTIKQALQALETELEDGSGSLTADDLGQADFANGTVTIAGATGISTTAAGNTLSIDLDDTAVTAGAYGAADTVATYTVDQQGRLTLSTDVLIDIAHTQVNDFDAGVQANTLDSLAAPVADVALNSQKITGLADPVDAQDAATKAYVDASATGLDVKDSVRVATTGDLSATYAQGSLSLTADAVGALIVDGVSLVAGDRVLVKNESDAAANGIYTVNNAGGVATNFVLVRAEDADNTPETGEVTPGMFTFVEEGSTFADAGFVLQTTGTITLGTTELSFVQFSGAGQIDSGAGLTKSGNQINVESADAGRIVVNANDIDLATHGTAGTYNGLTVDAYGRVSSFAQPTTLAGYSITDAQPLDATLTALAGLTFSADEIVYATGDDAFSTTSLTTYARSLLDDVDAASARTTLGLGSMAVQNANAVAITGGTLDNIEIDGGTF